MVMEAGVDTAVEVAEAGVDLAAVVDEAAVGGVAVVILQWKVEPTGLRTQPRTLLVHRKGVVVVVPIHRMPPTIHRR